MGGNVPEDHQQISKMKWDAEFRKQTPKKPQDAQSLILGKNLKLRVFGIIVSEIFLFLDPENLRSSASHY